MAQIEADRQEAARPYIHIGNSKLGVEKVAALSRTSVATVLCLQEALGGLETPLPANRILPRSLSAVLDEGSPPAQSDTIVTGAGHAALAG
ncbi:hypothetical protein JHL17_24625 [Azospirillum sp. YIM B02556]|uniref:Uncharacterized protein n=1 Tax=Azospirillum endophyticum TaxID=2800326 RepID=A0ABS1FAY7_9PROT|nr:hypothetical protein [Azospirillum endophyticum]MBK1840593.1 hypothetical protein [Azospirillum endophyticum]